MAEGYHKLPCIHPPFGAVTASITSDRTCADLFVAAVTFAALATLVLGTLIFPIASHSPASLVSLAIPCIPSAKEYAVAAGSSRAPGHAAHSLRRARLIVQAPNQLPFLRPTPLSPAVPARASSGAMPSGARMEELATAVDSGSLPVAFEETEAAPAGDAHQLKSFEISAPIYWEQAATVCNHRTRRITLVDTLRITQPNSFMCLIGDFVGIALQNAHGQTATMILNSAATNTLVTPNASLVLGCPYTGEKARIGVAGVGGGYKETYQVAMGSMTAAGVPDSTVLVQQLHAMEIPMIVGEGISGILGLDFLNLFDGVEFDFRQEGSIRFFNLTRGPGLAKAWSSRAAGLREVPLKPVRRGLFTTMIQIDGKVTLPGLLDTAAPFSTLNHEAAEALGIPVHTSPDLVWNHAANGRPAKMHFAERDVNISVPAIYTGREELPVGSLRPMVADLPAFSGIGLDNGPALLLGIDALKSCGRVILSTASHRMFL